MCGAGEIYCRQRDCIQPVGWYIIEPCDAFAIANSATAQAFDGIVGSLNWNAATCGCSIPRVLRRQRCTYRTCNECAWIAMESTFTAVQEWAEGVQENPAKWAQSEGDYLLFRRTKMRLKSDYEHTQRKSGDQRAAGLQNNSANANNNHQHETTSVLSDTAEAADSIHWSSLDMFGGGFLNINSSDPHRVSEATYGEKWNGGVEDEFMSLQGLQASTKLDFNQEASNTASEFGATLNIDYPPNTLSQNMYEPPQSISTFQKYWDKGEDANRLSQLHTEVLPLQYTEVDFNDPFWTSIFTSSGDSTFNGHTYIY